MITVKEAEAIIFDFKPEVASQQTKLEEALGKVLGEDILADRDFPPFDRVMMDGIAIRLQEFNQGQRKFKISGVNLAGSPPLKGIPSNCCVEVMTGSVLPEDMDTVIRYEDIEINDGMATIGLESLQMRANIHGQGLDQPKGAVLLKSGVVLEAPEIGLLATVGKSEVLTLRVPVISIVSTGDELVAVKDTPAMHQIRMSNSYTIQAAIKRQFGWGATVHHIQDSVAALEKRIKEILLASDVVILSGGVSRGKKDFVPQVLSDLGVEKQFHKVKQRPGKPFWFGKTEQGKAVFALPGNPVSTFLCYTRYVAPWLVANFLKSTSKRMAVLSEDIVFDKPLTYFSQVHCRWNGSVLEAIPIRGGGSGDLANLVSVNAFLELDLAIDHFKKGESFPVYPFKDI